MEPDWESLNEINFLLYSRIATSMNAALEAMTIAEMPDQSDQPAEWWYGRAKAKTESVLNLVMAWSWLIQYKAGTDLVEKAKQPFRLQLLLDWLTINLQLIPPLTTEHNIYLDANQQTLQEALLLLHSVASTQGSGVGIMVGRIEHGVQFHVRFARIRQASPYRSIDHMIEKQGRHWRQQTIAFELEAARDFLRMNGIEVELNDTGAVGEFTFCVSEPGKPRGDTRPDDVPPEVHRKQIIERIIRATMELKGPKPDTASGDTVKADMQRWHAPPDTHRVDLDPTLVRSQSIPDPVFDQPRRPGGWHAPRQVRLVDMQTPIIVSVELPEPAVPKSYLERETQEIARPELFDDTLRESKNDGTRRLDQNQEKTNHD